MQSLSFNPFRDLPRRANEIPRSEMAILPHGQFNQTRGLLAGKDSLDPQSVNTYDCQIASWMWLQTVRGLEIVHPLYEHKEPGCCVLKRNDQPFSVEPLSGEKAQRLAARDLPTLTWQVQELGSKILARD